MLNWAESPYDFNELSLKELHDPTELLAELTKDPTPLLTHLAKNPRKRLGSYVESLISFWLEYVPQVEVIATNLQVQDGTTTVGEFDILCTINGEPTHIECATKFYLQRTPSTDWQQWVGTGLKDRLDIKAKKFARQLQLGKTVAGREALKGFGLEAVQPRVIFTGYLFAHISQTDTWPEAKCLHHHTGWWCRQQELYTNSTSLEEDEQRGIRWVVMQKPHWLAPATNDVLSQTYSPQEWKGLLKKIDSPILAAKLEKSPDSTILKEIERGFITPNDWPQDIPNSTRP